MADGRFCPSLNQSREHGRFGSPSGRHRPRPLRANSISRDSRAIISLRRRHLAALDLAADQRTLANSVVTPSTVTEPMPRFQSFGEELAFRHHRLTHVAMVDGVIDRLPSLRSGRADARSRR